MTKIIGLAGGTLVAFLLLLTSEVTEAHSDITDEVEVGGYRVVMSYFGDAAFTGDSVAFSVYTYPLPEGDLETPAVGQVTIKKEEGTELFSGEMDVKDIDAPGFFTYTFADMGYHLVTLSLTMGNIKLPDVTFRLYVYENPANQVRATQQQQEVRDPLQTTESREGPNYLVVGFLVLIGASMGMFLWKGEALIKRIRKEG
jgi:hypothetical protein